MKTILLLVGIVALACGLLFVGQGSGIVRWPASSFMIDSTPWIYYGAGIATIGLVLVVVALR